MRKVFNGTNSRDIFVGTARDDRMTGRDGVDYLDGRGGDDSLNGGAGSDYLLGGQGHDTFVGGKGRDTFFFESLDEADSDTVIDFKSGADELLFESDIFNFRRAATPAVPWSYDEGFVKGTAALDANDFLIYDQDTGRFYYDADGSGAAAPILLFTLVNRPDVDVDDLGGYRHDDWFE